MNTTKVKELVQILMDCSDADADTASKAICKSPEAVILLGAACGLSTYVATTGATTAKAAAAVQVWPAAIGAGALSGAGLLAAKRFCGAMLKQSASGISRVDPVDISMLDSNIPE
jgi:hypothetical protein